MKTTSVLAVHGIGAGSGRSRLGFSAELKKRVLSRLPEVPENNWQECVWEDLNDAMDERIGRIVDGLFRGPVLSGLLGRPKKWKKALEVLAKLAKPQLEWLVRSILDLGLDYAWYMDSDHGKRIRDRLRRRIDETVRSTGANPLLVAHSLGSVVAYDTLAESVLAGEPLPVAGLVTFGSPLGWTFDLREADGKKETSFKSIGTAEWRNCYYRQDCVPLYKELPNPFRGNSVKNVRLDLPPDVKPVASHCAYWTDQRFADRIADWLKTLGAAGSPP